MDSFEWKFDAINDGENGSSFHEDERLSLIPVQNYYLKPEIDQYKFVSKFLMDSFE